MSEALSAEDLKAIRERCDKATPGPWRVKSWGSAGESPEPPEWTIDGPDGYRITAEDVYPGHGEDVYFIAHARTDIPRLLATIEEARREQPARVTDEMQKLAREIADDVFAGTKYNFGTDPRTRFAIRDVLEAAAYAGLAAVPKEDEETNG